LCGTKIEYAGGEVHLPLSNKNYSYVLPLLLFDTLEHRAQHMQSRQTRTTKNNTPIRKSLKKRIRLGSRIANARNSRDRTIVEKEHLSRDLYYNTQDYMLDIF
jgi:hypothetical protein